MSSVPSFRGDIVDVVASFTRQSNTNAYSAGQIVNGAAGDPLTFAQALRANIGTGGGGSGWVASSRLIVKQTSLGGIQFRLTLCKSLAAASVADAASWSTVIANKDNELGWIDFLNPVSSGSAPDATVYEGVP